MADFALLNDTQYWFLIDENDAAGAVVLAPAGEVDTVVSGSASLAMTVEPMPSGPSAGMPSVHCVPMVQLSDASNAGGGITCTVHNLAGLPMPVVPTFSIGPNLTPVALSLDTATVVTASQPVPAAPGP